MPPSVAVHHSLVDRHPSRDDAEETTAVDANDRTLPLPPLRVMHFLDRIVQYAFLMATQALLLNVVVYPPHVIIRGMEGYSWAFTLACQLLLVFEYELFLMFNVYRDFAKGRGVPEEIVVPWRRSTFCPGYPEVFLGHLFASVVCILVPHTRLSQGPGTILCSSLYTLLLAGQCEYLTFYGEKEASRVGRRVVRIERRGWKALFGSVFSPSSLSFS